MNKKYYENLLNLKIENHIALLKKMFIEDKMQEKIIKCTSMEEAFNVIKKVSFNWKFYGMLIFKVCDPIRVIAKMVKNLN